MEKIARLHQTIGDNPMFSDEEKDGMRDVDATYRMLFRTEHGDLQDGLEHLETILKDFS